MTGCVIDAPDLPRILYSCYASQSREGEQFVSEHVFGYQLSGTMLLDDGQQQYSFGEGEVRLLRRNQLMKFHKQPPAGGEFEILSVFPYQVKEAAYQFKELKKPALDSPPKKQTILPALPAVQ